MEECFDLFRGDECVSRGASLREAADLLKIDSLELALTVIKYERCVVGEFRAVPSNASPQSI
jgi:hypothetical protein